jgi:hypothetical protein
MPKERACLGIVFILLSIVIAFGLWFLGSIIGFFKTALATAYPLQALLYFVVFYKVRGLTMVTFRLLSIPVCFGSALVFVIFGVMAVWIYAGILWLALAGYMGLKWVPDD